MVSGKKLLLEYKKSEIFEGKRDIDNERTKEEKDWLHLSIPSDQLSFYSL